MKWVSHKLLTGSIVFAATGNPIMTLLSTIGSIIPDAVEGSPNGANYRQWRKHHRKYSHWFVPYVIMFFLGYTYSASHGLSTVTIRNAMMLLLSNNTHNSIAVGAFIMTYLAIGCCLHIIEDAICGKIPGIDPKEKIGVKIFYVGSNEEYAIVLLVSFALIIMRCKM